MSDFSVPFTRVLRYVERHGGVLLTIVGEQRVFCRATSRSIHARINIRVVRRMVRAKDFNAIKRFFP
jgi:hypothetical protein